MQSAKLFKPKHQSVGKFEATKPPKNPKYEHVVTKLNTGTTVRDVELLTEARASKLNNEVFARISAKKLSTLLAKNCENHSVYIPSLESLPYNPR